MSACPNSRSLGLHSLGQRTDCNSCQINSRSMFCDHANEVPAKCPCVEYCYCKSHTCAPKVKTINTKEPPSVINDNPFIVDLVIEDMRSRSEFGERKYGVKLQSFNGRNSIVDAVQEVYDLAVYIKQAQEELKQLGSDLHDLLKMENASSEDILESIYGILNLYPVLEKAACRCCGGKFE